jgi:uncharacterized protein DUF5681
VEVSVSPPDKPRGRPFERGRSGNPNGRPKGSRNRITRALEELIDGNAEALVAKAIEKALNGDAGMLRALLSRTVPARRARTVELELPNIENAADAPAGSAAVLAACSCGEISPAEADAIMALIRTHVHIIEAADQFRARLAVLEAKLPEPLPEQRKSEEGQKCTSRYEVLRSKLEFELTPPEILELGALLRQDPIYPSTKAWDRALRGRSLGYRKNDPLNHKRPVRNPCPACRTTSEQLC